MEFRNARVWLTGASSGIGEALVAPLVARGARVAVTARRTDLLEAVARRAGGDATLVVPADVTDQQAVTAAARTIEAAWGGIDLAIFNAGGNVEPDGPSRFDADAYVRTMTLNYFSVVFGIDAVLGGMLARGRGHLAAVASLGGYRALPTAGAYGASKAAVIYLLESLRFDLEPSGIGVTVINPGFVRTPLTARNRFRMPFLMDADAAAERIVAGFARDRREIHFPGALSWPMKLLRIAPEPVYAAVMRRLGH